MQLCDDWMFERTYFFWKELVQNSNKWGLNFTECLTGSESIRNVPLLTRTDLEIASLFPKVDLDLSLSSCGKLASGIKEILKIL